MAEAPSPQGDGPLYVAGAGDLGRDVLAILDALGWTSSVRAFVQEGMPAPAIQVRGVPVADEACLAATAPARLVAAVGSPTRRRWFEGLEARGHRFLTAVHPKAAVHADAWLGAGCTVFAGVAVGAHAHVARHVLLNWNCALAHDAVVGPFSHVAIGAVVGAGSRIGSGSMVGAGAVVANGVHVGTGTLVGTGAVVTRDLPDGVVAYGNPAKVERPLRPGEWDALVRGRPTVTRAS